MNPENETVGVIKDYFNETKECQPYKTIFEEANEIINGDREETYGDPGINLRHIATGWSVIFEDGEFTADRVALAMTWLKICREVHKHKRDNLVDGCGYMGLIEKMERYASLPK